MLPQGDHPSDERTWLEIDLGALMHNVGVMRRVVGPEVRILAVVKADGYGHGAVQAARAALAAGAARLGVASCAEGEELRDAGIRVPVQVLGVLLPGEIDRAVALELIPTVHDLAGVEAFERAAAAQHKKAPVHLKIDTGMGRLGILPGGHESSAPGMAAPQAVAAARAVHEAAHLQLEGAFMHFPDAADREGSAAQLSRFEAACADIRAAGVPIPLCHAAASAATMHLPQAHLDMVRLGICLYGAHEDPEALNTMGLRNVMRWLARVALVKDYPAGHPLGYGSTYTTTRPTRIAVLPVGYADGYRRMLGNQAHALVCGRRVPVVGRVSMDYTLVDVTGVPGVRVGSVATLVGRDGAHEIRIADLSLLTRTIPDETVTQPGRRVARRYIGMDEVD